MSSQASSSDLSDLHSARFYEENSSQSSFALEKSTSPQPTPQSQGRHAFIIGHGFEIAESSTGSTSTTKARRKRTCYIYMHMPSANPETKYVNWKTKREEWRCKYCEKKYSLNGGTVIIKTHLLEHGITDESPRLLTTKKRQLSIEEAVTNGESRSRLRRKLNPNGRDSQDSTIQGDPLEYLYTRFLATTNLPLTLVESDEFRDFLYYLNPEIETWLPSSHATIAEWITRNFKAQKERITQRLQSARSIIHLSVDSGMAPNHKPLIVICAHYISEDGVLEKSLLAAKEIDGKHDGENLAKYVLNAIKDYGMASKLGYFQMDNATNNDTLIQHVSGGM
jgi:hypothetical protein